MTPPMTRFRTDIEGLRGLAILLVVAYHCQVPGLSGGFVGVDVFFVLSGYLITSLPISELRLGHDSPGSLLRAPSPATPPRLGPHTGSVHADLDGPVRTGRAGHARKHRVGHFGLCEQHLLRAGFAHIRTMRPDLVLVSYARGYALSDEQLEGCVDTAVRSLAGSAQFDGPGCRPTCGGVRGSSVRSMRARPTAVRVALMCSSCCSAVQLRA